MVCCLPRCLAVAAGVLMAASSAHAVIYQCVDAKARRTYSLSPCAEGAGREVSIDGLPAQAADPSGGPQATAPPRLPTAEDAQRIEQLAGAPAAYPEQRRGRALAIAAIRFGIDAKLTPAERQTREALLAELGSDDARVRADGERALRTLYGRHGLRARGRGIVPEDFLGAAPRVAPPPPLANPPAAELKAPSPPMARPARPSTDPVTGEVLVPSGDRLVDPLTGRTYMRSGRLYVDPATRRTLPGD